MTQVQPPEPATPATRRMPPDFEQVVKTVLATFAVFTGLTISNYVKDTIFTVDHLRAYSGWQDWAGDWQCWAFAALVCLLLRYLIGSAIHLNHVYVTPKGKDEPRSFSVLLLFKDVIFLVIFGVIAVFISKADNADLFVNRAGWFLFSGLTWSILDVLIRASWPDPREHPRPVKERPFWLIWILLDGLQLAFTWLFVSCIEDDLTKAVVLALGFVVFLFFDIRAMVRAVQRASTA
jgi:hypothetical protein